MNRNEERKDANRDPISGAPGSHPVGTGLGAAAGGMAAGARVAQHELVVAGGEQGVQRDRHRAGVRRDAMQHVLAEPLAQACVHCIRNRVDVAGVELEPFQMEIVEQHAREVRGGEFSVMEADAGLDGRGFSAASRV